MTTEELCDKALAAGHNCTVTIVTGPVHEFQVLLVFVVLGLVAVLVAFALAFDSWQEHRTKRHEAEVRELARQVR